jgi:hypothetical protein
LLRIHFHDLVNTIALKERGFRELKFVSGVTDTVAMALPKPVLRVP